MEEQNKEPEMDWIEKLKKEYKEYLENQKKIKN